jgi:hypothetical protein
MPQFVMLRNAAVRPTVSGFESFGPAIATAGAPAPPSRGLKRMTCPWATR